MRLRVLRILAAASVSCTGANTVTHKRYRAMLFVLSLILLVALTEAKAGMQDFDFAALARVWTAMDANRARSVLERVCSEQSARSEACMAYRNHIVVTVDSIECPTNYRAEPAVRDCAFTVQFSGRSMSCTIRYEARGHGFDDRAAPAPRGQEPTPPRYENVPDVYFRAPGPSTLRCSEDIVTFIGGRRDREGTATSAGPGQDDECYDCDPYVHPLNPDDELTPVYRDCGLTRANVRDVALVAVDLDDPRAEQKLRCLVGAGDFRVAAHFAGELVVSERRDDVTAYRWGMAALRNYLSSVGIDFEADDFFEDYSRLANRPGRINPAGYFDEIYTYSSVPIGLVGQGRVRPSAREARQLAIIKRNRPTL